jgi:hypothetical protein
MKQLIQGAMNFLEYSICKNSSLAALNSDLIQKRLDMARLTSALARITTNRKRDLDIPRGIECILGDFNKVGFDHTFI